MQINFSIFITWKIPKIYNNLYLYMCIFNHTLPKDQLDIRKAYQRSREKIKKIKYMDRGENVGGPTRGLFTICFSSTPSL